MFFYWTRTRVGNWHTYRGKAYVLEVFCVEEKTKRGPLLYISQTFSVVPANNMQEVFTSRQELQIPAEEPQPKEEKTRKKRLKSHLRKHNFQKRQRKRKLSLQKFRRKLKNIGIRLVKSKVLRK